MSENLPERQQDPRNRSATKTRQTLDAGQIDLSISPFPKIEEMEWLKQNCPEFLNDYNSELIEEGRHRRRTELIGQICGSVAAMAVFALVGYAIYRGNPVTATILFASATAITACAAVIAVSRGHGPLPGNLQARGARIQDEQEHIEHPTPDDPPTEQR